MDEIMVSVICNAFNHESFIRDALDGFVMQKTNFKFEVLVHDDASTDKTADIIREYEKKYPDIIKPIYETENQYSKGNLGKIQYGRARGKYIALCEGDDYWTDENKLQMQYDALEAHPEIDLCAHEAVMVKEFTKDEIGYVQPARCDTVLTPEQVIVGGGAYFATASLFCRAEVVKNYMEFRKFMHVDYTIQIQGSLRGGVYYLSNCMSAYRIRQTGSWSAVTLKSGVARINSWNKTIKMREILNEETGYKYNGAIKEADDYAKFMILRIEGKFKELKKEPYLSIYKNYSKKEKIYMYMEKYTPELLSKIMKLRGKR